MYTSYALTTPRKPGGRSATSLFPRKWLHIYAAASAILRWSTEGTHQTTSQAAYLLSTPSLPFAYCIRYKTDALKMRIPDSWQGRMKAPGKPIRRQPIHFHSSKIRQIGESWIKSTADNDTHKVIIVNATSHASGKKYSYTTTTLTHLQVVALKSGDSSLNAVKESYNCHHNKLKSSIEPHCTSPSTIINYKAGMIGQDVKSGTGQNAATFHRFKPLWTPSK